MPLIGTFGSSVSSHRRQAQSRGVARDQESPERWQSCWIVGLMGAALTVGVHVRGWRGRVHRLMGPLARSSERGDFSGVLTLLIANAVGRSGKR